MKIKRIGVSADHGGFELKEKITILLKGMGLDVVDFGATELDDKDDYPDFVIPMARAIVKGEVESGIACCGSGVGACVAVNKIGGIRASLVADVFSARQGVEDDDLNIICLGGRVIGQSHAYEIVKAFINAEFSGAERHKRRLAKVAALELKEGRK